MTIPFDRTAFHTQSAAYWFDSAASWNMINELSGKPCRYQYRLLNNAYQHLHALMGYRADQPDF